MEKLYVHVKDMEKKLKVLPPISSECCIYRVPKRLRGVNDKAYTPQVVSLGPLHHGGKDLEAMEEHKMRYVKDFLERTMVRLEDFLEYFMKQEARIRACYAVTIECNEPELAKMILVDATFTFEVMLRTSFPTLQKENDRIFGKPRMLRDIIYDMLLLENQVPFFILEYLNVLAHAYNPLVPRLSLLNLTHNFFQKRVYSRPLDETLEKLSHSTTRIHHFVDFLLKCHRPLQLPAKRKIKTLTIPSATKLHQAGVQFMGVEDKNLFDIKFDNGILKIPLLRIRGSTEIFFRNLIAYEQFELLDTYIKDYVFFIDGLVDTAKDVELLSESGILESRLPDDDAAAEFINSLDLGPFVFSRKSYFTGLFEELNDYYKVPWHRWKASLKQDYFSTPWVGLSIIGAAVIVLLTFIQTVCSIISL